MSVMTAVPLCGGCGATPDELDEYVQEAELDGITPAEYVREGEGTYNPETGRFLCTPCYRAAGEPTAPWPGWKCP